MTKLSTRNKHNITHNHIINCAESLSFRWENGEVREELINLFKNGHSSASAHFMLIKIWYILMLIINGNHSYNPDYSYVAHLF